ncbi:MAG TPA: helix-turn-helix domain-containing GNAT family N-acetyltransferase [Gemmatimonadaceae bacterium]|nr:helix-turn-helix domain-containing GNAT family N-acetyltransferase [Gemmatimonadaceae bacterium]
MSGTLAAAQQLRRFNRFYTQRLGLLNTRHLQSPFTLAEARVIYELAHRERPTASEIAVALLVDEGYLSRILQRLRERGMVRARTAQHDGRQRWLALTPKGRRAFQTLDARATDSVERLIRNLPPARQQQLVDAVATVETLLSDAPPAGTVGLRPTAPGDLGWVVQRNAELYHQEYGWNADYERLVARIVGDYAAAPEGPVNRCWIATVGGHRAGCVFLMPHEEPGVARLRLLLVEPWARGHKLGTLLVATCIDGAREAGCARLTLWTNDVLVAARRIYERAGFRLVKSERHESFGASLVGQTWDLLL